MKKLSGSRLCLTVALLSCALGVPSLHAAEVSQDSLDALTAKIDALQKELQAVKQQQAEQAKSKTKQTAAAAAPAATPEKPATSGVKVTFGGFVEGAMIERSKNETTDMASNFNTAIPFKNSVNSNQSEFRGSARQSRITMLAQANASDNVALAAYGEADFLGAATTANSTESNSYNPRLRVGYGTVDFTDSGWHVLAGQNWSLLTTNKVGINPRQENLPLTIDAQYVPGFNWTRTPQLRVAKDFLDQKITLGLSAETPQASLGGITVPGTVNATNTGVSPLNTTTTYSSDFAPDLIAKAAFDPGYGHYEVFGVERSFHDNITATFRNEEAYTVSGGAAAIVPVIKNKLDVQANVMFGQSIGRYGSAQLPDFAFGVDGKIKPLTGTTALLGAVGHPTPSWDVYTYAGYEGVNRYNTANTTYGYGDFGLNNSGCNVQRGTCTAQTSDVWQLTGGVWNRIYQGNYGKVQLGLQDSITRRDAFSDNKGINPHSYENIIMTSFRFYPQ